MSSTVEISNWLENYQHEINAAYLYQVIAQAEGNQQLKQVYANMASAETKHAAYWEAKLSKQGYNHNKIHPDTRTRILAWVARKFGPQTILAILIGGEQKASDSFKVDRDEVTRRMSEEEKSHERLMLQIAGTPMSKVEGGMAGGLLAQLEGRHKASGGNALRAAVLGANDGLVSNLSLVMGVAGAALSGKSILITGLAGLLAGAASMALGEWLSVQSSRELYQHQIEIEKREIESAPEEEAHELALIYQAKGLSQEQAQQLAAQIMSDPATTADTLAREELGINPDELGGSAWEAALTSFLLFAIGAIIPVLPFIFVDGSQAILISLVCSAVGLFGIGALITLMTGKNWVVSGLRQVAFGLIAAGLTFGIGKLIGVSIAG